MTPAERGRLGGLKTYERYGSDHMRMLQQRSWEKQKALDPNAGFRLGYAGLAKNDPYPANGAWTNRDGTPKYQQRKIAGE